ncbi:alpha/beta hydrolase [Caulobacter sp. D4A]|uniref:alpha/beta fold hydrolase n=1 Tax=unclassified Caulobacter TaxID=2648921 RepID=UPI000D7332AF|nr:MULTISPECIES: alpha/beta fold hydrolase [unclassified Caulobacter]PXA82888.1 alpha/beta hydrolase [Caulobacter sp. D4A]PXA88783.1 alpha/beta hydrolase [Caulobacter sp. D5]
MPSFTTSDGLSIAYQVWGEDETRPPVVLHHGFSASGLINWKGPGVVDALVAAGRKVVAIDARGHGASDKPHDPAFYGEARMARDVGELIDHLGAAAIDLAGYSMGAIVSLICASQEPRVRRLVTGGVGEGVVATGGVDTRHVPSEAIVEALLTEDPSTIRHPAAAPFRLFADAIGADRKALAAQASVVHAKPIALDAITAPTLVVAGDDDPLAVHPERLAAAIPGARSLLVGGDHRSAVANPAFARAIVEFFAD